jgi:hypothetical protein
MLEKDVHNHHLQGASCKFQFYLCLLLLQQGSESSLHYYKNLNGGGQKRLMEAGNSTASNQKPRESPSLVLVINDIKLLMLLYQV